MGYMTINNRRVAFTDEKNVLSVIRKSGIDLPTFCYHSELSTYGACRMCVVEDDRGKICILLRSTKRWNGDLYAYTTAAASQKDDPRIAAFFSLQRLYDLYRERSLYFADTVPPAGD